MSNSKQATNFGGGNKDTVYHFIREMIREGECAWFVDRNGRYRVKWEDIVTRHIEYREKKKGGNTLNITWKQASNNLRESLLHRYCDDGAKEFEERQTLGKKRKIVEREFQMPPEVFRKLFVPSEIQLPDEEKRRVVVDPPDEETPFEIAGLSSEDIDTILKENANDDGNQPEAAVQYNGSSSGPVECETSRISASDLESTQEVQSLLQLVEDPDYEIAALFSEDVLKENANNDGDQAGEVQSLLQLVEDPDYEMAGLSSEDIDTILKENANDDGDQPEAAVQYNGSSSGPVETSEIPVSHLELSQGTCHGNSSKIGSSDELPGDQCETSRISVSDLESTQEVQSLLQLVEDPDNEQISDISAKDPDWAQEEISTNSYNDMDQLRVAVVQDVFTPSGCAKIFDTFTKELSIALEKTCSNSGNDVDQREVVHAICPSSGPMQGGTCFLILLVEELLESDTKGVAHFEKIGDVVLEKTSPRSLSGFVPAAKEAGTVLITVFTEAGRKLGTAYFMYVDVMEEILKFRYGPWSTLFPNHWKQ